MIVYYFRIVYKNGGFMEFSAVYTNSTVYGYYRYSPHTDRQTDWLTDVHHHDRRIQGLALGGQILNLKVFLLFLDLFTKFRAIREGGWRPQGPLHEYANYDRDWPCVLKALWKYRDIYQKLWIHYPGSNKVVYGPCEQESE